MTKHLWENIAMIVHGVLQRGKPCKDKYPKSLIIHPLNEATEFVHEQNFEMNVDKKIPTKLL